MDEIDLLILRKLLNNSRLTYRELAEMSNMSVSAIHKRIKKLEDDEIITAYVAQPSIVALKCLFVLIFGTSDAKSMDAVSRELGQHESIRFVGITGGKFLYITAYLRDISQLQDYSTYVSRTAHISDPTIGIINVPYITTPEPLSSIDFKILKTLNRDARKSITDIADDVGLSAKTVRKRLDRMSENKLASFSIQWMPHKTSFVMVFHLILKEGTDMNSSLKHINEKYSQNIAYCLNYSNIPNLITLHTWAKSTQDAQRIQEELHTEGFKDVIPHIFIDAKWYDCWVDQLLRTK
ncbi:MAG: winged helix-turn-helix transcriptional regulator [Candidatus Lokiarchaeota archaeon]|nr:winged helix-turn-helix transcriptional regulator [Candidatus Lokiarchaeota archaeon]